MTEPRPDGLARRPAVLTVVVAFALVAVLAAWLVPWSWVPGGRLVPARATALFTPDQIARMERYSWLRRGPGWTSYFLTLALLLALAFTARGARLVRRATSRRRWWLGVPAGVLLVLALERLVALPFAVAGHAVDRSYGISRQGWGGWLGDQARSLGVSWFVTSLVLLVLVLAARRSPRWWFAWAGAAALLLGLAGSVVYPVQVEPLVNRFAPLPVTGTSQRSYLSYSTTAASSFVQPAMPNGGFCFTVSSDSLSMNDVCTPLVMLVIARVARLIAKY